MAVLNFFDVIRLYPKFFDDADIDNRLDKDEIKMAILHRCGTLLPLYTDTDMFKAFSDSFFKRKALTIKKLIDSTEFEYNPIDNYDRTEETTREYTSEGNANSSNTQENKTAAYDSNTYVPKDNITNNDNAHNTGSGTDNVTTKTRGNIGVTTTQQMINQERRVVLFNVYEWIAIEFEQNFFICVS